MLSGVSETSGTPDRMCALEIRLPLIVIKRHAHVLRSGRSNTQSHLLWRALTRCSGIAPNCQHSPYRTRSCCARCCAKHGAHWAEARDLEDGSRDLSGDDSRNALCRPLAELTSTKLGLCTDPNHLALRCIARSTTRRPARNDGLRGADEHTSVSCIPSNFRS